MAPVLTLPYGFKDAKVLLLVQSIIGDFLQGGLIFGWNALALMLKQQGNYNRNCTQPISDIEREGLNTNCAWQESQLAVLWTIGVFALNFGPVIVGPVLDYVGPKITAMLGTMLNMVGLILLGCSNTHDFNGLPAGAVILGLAGITFHLSQLHISNLFPRSRGFISSLLVAGFTGCGAIFYFLDLIFVAAGGSRGAYRLIMIMYSLVVGIWLGLSFWMMPWHALQVGQVYLWTGKGRFKVMDRKEVERQAVAIRMTALDGGKRAAAMNGVGGAADPGLANGAAGAASQQDAGTLHDLEHAGQSDDEIDKDMALAYMGLRHANSGGAIAADSADPTWLDRESPPPTVPVINVDEEEAAASHGQGNGRVEGPAEGASGEPSDGTGATLQQLNGNAASGPSPRGGRPPAREHFYTGEHGSLVFESRRFVELRKQGFWKQFTSAESTGMGIFYTLNVFCIQFYLGTTRLQLEHKGDSAHVVTNIANVVPAFGFIGIPVISWLLDSKGYGVTLAVINLLGVLASIFQAMPSLYFQIVTLIVWCAGRFFLYTSYFTIFGALFGAKNFGRMVAIDNSVNGLVGLLQFPLTSWGLHGLHGNFTAINILQFGLLLPLFWFCWCMYGWETDENNQVPILPNEGEELPCNVKGPRQMREATFLTTLERRLSGAGAMAA
ncbi:probable solute carrier family 43 member 3 at N-terminal half [Coccomyxa sp. Obi]|nr:probable solute carrier family 43 member 3 at N-terminal half [Coccomyxa sp. Obi]